MSERLYVLAVRMPLRGTALALTGYVTALEDTWLPSRDDAGVFGEKMAAELADYWEGRGFAVRLEPAPAREGEG